MRNHSIQVLPYTRTYRGAARVGRILQMHANKRAELDKVYSGDIAAAVGFKSTHVSLYLVLTKQTVNDNLQMQLTHTCDDRLACLLIRVCTERRIFLNEVERHSSDEEPFSALAFKIMADPFVGKLAFFRVYSGTINSGSYVYIMVRSSSSSQIFSTSSSW